MRSALRRVLDALDPVPAFLLGRQWNYLAWNVTANRIFAVTRVAPPYDYNAIWRIFTDPRSKHIHQTHWEHVAQKMLAEFRSECARFADETWYIHLIGDLQRVSPEFRAWWPRHDVRGNADALKGIKHPVVGWLQFEQTMLQVPSMPDLKMVIYTPLPQTDTREKLQQLLDDGDEP